MTLGSYYPRYKHIRGYFTAGHEHLFHTLLSSSGVEFRIMKNSMTLLSSTTWRFFGPLMDHLLAQGQPFCAKPPLVQYCFSNWCCAGFLRSKSIFLPRLVSLVVKPFGTRWSMFINLLQAKTNLQQLKTGALRVWSRLAVVWV